MQAVLGFVFFAAAGFLGVVLASTIVPRLRRFDDGPPASTSPDFAIVGVCAVLGAIITPHASVPAQIAFFAILFVALAAIWHTDVRTGIVPDVFTLGPLAIIIIVAVIERDWMLLVSIALPSIPFAAAAAMSKGRGMGWGDVKLVALGAAVLGAQTATLAFAVACIAAVIVAYLKHRTAQPIAFAPYLVGAIALAIPVITVF